MFPFKTQQLQKITQLFGNCDCIVCIRNINGVPIFETTTEDQINIYYGVSVKDLYEITNLEYRSFPLPWNLPS